ncbi:hypothetical protein EIP91_011976 [Steccherinum ochraceum]|uniref:Uncharacterized protein n=1 Tax=Steccherinum ochraceum TaxID=92696 RepID=A0A4R0RXJ3_9APHY|nr:hypothetical protein EIP91_011976 [Steccherinum ochraceum]
MHFHLFFVLLVALFPLSLASPLFGSSLAKRTDPVFPDQPTSCPICAQNYPNINSCAQAAPVLANVSEILFNPGAFIDVIKCACTDTFQSAFPQCVDCFTKTNQTDVLNTPDLPSILSGLRSICALESSLIGNVSNTNGETTPSAPTPSPTTSGAKEQFALAFSAPFIALLGLFTLNFV